MTAPRSIGLTMIPALTVVLSFLMSGVLSAAQPPAAVQITSPVSGATLTGTVTFSASATGAASVDYWIAGHSIVQGSLPTSAPYQVTLDTTNLWDGSVQIKAVSRDSGGNVLAISAPVTLIIQNLSEATLSLSAPDLTQPLSGYVTWQIDATDTRGVQALYYVIDGKTYSSSAHFGSTAPPDYKIYGNSFSDTYTLDTTALRNGTHYFALSLIPSDLPDGTPAHATAQIIREFTVKNDSSPIELRSNLRYLYFQPGQTSPVKLSSVMWFSDGSSKTVSGSYASDNIGAATVSNTGLVSPGTTQGLANITISSGGYQTTVQVINVTTHAGFPHFTKDGHIVYDYDPARSLWVRTMFNTGMWGVLTYTPGFAANAHAAGINALTSGFYQNPSDYGYPDFVSFIAHAVNLLDDELQSLASNDFYLVGQGDDIQRNVSEMNNTLTSPWAPQSILDSLSQLVASGRTISIEMQDETGGNPVPANYRKVMAIMNSAPARPPLTWPPAGLQGADVFAAWMGDPTMSDYASMYWTQPGSFREEFPWGWSLADTNRQLVTGILGKSAGLQADKPKYLEVYSYRNSYLKRVSGDYYRPGKDQIGLPGFSPEQTTAQILYAAAMGFAGVRVYGYDGSQTYGAQDQGWAYHRATDPVGTFQQIGSAPSSTHQDVVDRWHAMSNAFNLIQNLEPYMLSPQMNGIDLGADIVTGARQLSDGSGRMLIVINMVDNLQTASVDLSSYRYGGATTVTRYHINGISSNTETVPNDASQTVTLAPGESIVWVFPNPDGAVTPPPNTGTPPATTETLAVAVTSPTANQPVSGIITLAANGSGISSVQFQVDGQNAGGIAAAPPYILSLDTTNLGDGTHAILAVASDAAGNQAVSAPVTIMVTNQPATPASCSAAAYYFDTTTFTIPIPAVTPSIGLTAAWMMTDGCGAVAADSSGNNNKLTLNNATWSTGSTCKLSACLSFDGSSQSAQANLDLSGTASVTVTFWMNTPRYNDNDGLALEFASAPFGFNSSAGGFIINPNSSQSGGGYFEAGLKGDAGYNQILFSRPVAGTWHHYAFVFDKSAPADTQVTPYVDGVLVSYTKLTNSANSNTFAQDILNVMSRNGQSLFTSGTLQDLRIYSIALGAGDIATLAGPVHQ